MNIHEAAQKLHFLPLFADVTVSFFDEDYNVNYYLDPMGDGYVPVADTKVKVIVAIDTLSEAATKFPENWKKVEFDISA